MKVANDDVRVWHRRSSESVMALATLACTPPTAIKIAAKLNASEMYLLLCVFKTVIIRTFA